MNRIRYFLLTFFSFVIVLYWVGCQTNPPTVIDDGLLLGYVIVESELDSCAIYADNILRSTSTPDTIQLSAGLHTIRLERAGFRTLTQTVNVIRGQYITVRFIYSTKNVLLEDFANVSCTPCVTSNAIIESLKKYSYSDDNLNVIKYPTNFPAPYDPLYQAAKPYADARIQFYMVGVAPTICVDGTERPTATDSIKIKEKIDGQLLKKPAFILGVTDTIIGLNCSVKVSVKCIDTAGIDFSNLILHIAVVEKEIEFTSPPGSNGETKFYNVMRSLLPAGSGTAAGTFAKNEQRYFQFNGVLQSSWDVSKLKTIAFLQDKMNRMVYQSACGQ